MANKKIPDHIQKLIWYGQTDLNHNKNEIITAVLNKGNNQDIKWLFKNINQEKIKLTIAQPMKGQWDKKSLNLWQKYFNIQLSQQAIYQAIQSIK